MSDDIVERLHEACNGHPHAKIAWPHRLLHDAAAEITALRGAHNSALEAAYLAGFKASGEGWNGEYGPGDPEKNNYYIENRDVSLAALKAEGESR